jgi:hypothetical protein
MPIRIGMKKSFREVLRRENAVEDGGRIFRRVN